MIKKTLLLLTLLVSVVTGLWADTATITLKSTSGSSSPINYSSTNSSTAGNGSTKYLKISNDGTLVISCSSGYNITGISFTGHTVGQSNNKTYYSISTRTGSVDTGTLSSTTSTTTTSSTWSGSATSITFTSSASNAGAESMVVTYTSKTLSSIAISGIPTTTTYEAGEAFDPAGLVVTGTYTDGTTKSTETITSGIEWTIDYGTGNNALVAGTTSVGVTATVSGKTASTTVTGLTVHASNKKVVYAKEGSNYPYRIPALAQNKDGKLIAIADNRPSGVDIGNGEVDLVSKLSDDGSSWPTTATTFADGDGGTASTAYGYGDAAVVADRESNKVLAVSCYAVKGNNFWSGALASASMLSENGGSTWGTPTEISASDKATLIGVTGAGAFFTSGRILQSQYTKVGNYYRIYSTLCATTYATTTSNPKYNTSTWVVYSDDFGSTWKVLGGTSAAPVVNGNEAKVEELPDGRIVVSSRVNDNAGASTGNAGRYFNIFTYTNTADAEGSWGTAVKNTTISASDNNGTNGEILIVPAKDANNNDVYVALQTAPEGGTVSGTATNRSHLSVYYKVLDAYANFKDVSTFATDWTLSKELSSTTSAYSTMILQQDGNIGLLYEENSYNGGYDIVYNKFALSELAAGYTLNTSIDRKTFVKNYFTAYEATQTSWGSDVKAEFEDLVAALADGITTAELDAIYSFIADPSVNYDGKVVVLKCVGNTAGSDAKNSDNSDKLFTKYVYNNSDAIGVTTDAPTNQRSYDFVMHAGENGGYTFQSLSNTSLYLALDSNDDMCLSETAQEFILRKWSDASGATGTKSTAVTMDGYALQSARVNTSGSDSILVAISSAGKIDRLNYTSQSYGSSYFTTDFTIEICKYALTSDDKNVHVYGTMSDDKITGAHTFLGDADNVNSLVYVEDDNTYSAPTTTNNVVIKGTDGTYTCASLVLTDKVNVSIPIAFTATNATYERASTAKYGTIFFPYAPIKKEGYAYLELTAKQLNDDETGVLTFTEISGDPQPNTPYLYRNTTGGNLNLSTKKASVSVAAENPNVYTFDTAVTGWDMIGTYEKTTVFETNSHTNYESTTNNKVVDANSYYIKADGSKFAKVNGSFNSTAFRAYFSVAAESAAKYSSFTFVEGDILSTNIIGVEDNGDGIVKVIYDLSGRKLNDVKKGQVNIINGKKVLVK